MTRVSVIVPTRDRPSDLARCLPSILALENVDFELIVADQGSDDRGRAVVATYEGDSRVRYLGCEVPGKSRALNAALQLASGALVALTDDDCTVAPDWLTSALTLFERDASLGVILGPLVAAPHDVEAEYVPTFAPSRTRRLTRWWDRLDPHGVGANLQVRREVLGELGGFDECVGPGSRFRSGDDLDLAYRALCAGYAVLQASAHPAVVHWGVRRYDDGSARRLIWNNYYGKGARMMKGLRCGDPVAALALPYLAARESGAIAANVVRRRRPTGVGRLAPLLVGATRSLRQPVDRGRGVFTDCPPGTS